MPDPVVDLDTLYAVGAYLRKPRTLADIMRKGGLTRRTAYRWLDYLQERGYDIVRRTSPQTDGVTYQVLSAPKRR